MLREIPTNDNLILSTKSQKIQKGGAPKHMASANQTQAQLKHIWCKATWAVIRFYPTVRILTAMLREIPTNDNLILSIKSEKIQKGRAPKHMASANQTQAQLKHIWCKATWGVIRFYPTVRILTAMLREIPTNDNLILSTKSQKIQKGSKRQTPKAFMASAKPTQAQLKHIWCKATWAVIRFYPTVRILTAMLREIPTNDNLILSIKSEKIQKAEPQSIIMASAKPNSGTTQTQLRESNMGRDQILPYCKNPHCDAQRDSHKW